MEEWLYHRFYEIESRHWWFVARKRILWDIARTRARLAAGGRILDVGCGTGSVVEEFSRKHDAVGIDPNRTAMTLCRQRGLTQIWQGVLGDYETQSPFQLILLLDVIEHVRDDAGLLRSSLKHLASNGHVLVTVPAYPWLWTRHDTANQHERRYTRRSLTKALGDAGLTPVFLSYFNTILFPAALLTRLSQRLLARAGMARPEDPGLRLPTPMANGILTRIFASERFWLRCGSFPFGLSLIALAGRAGSMGSGGA